MYRTIGFANLFFVVLPVKVTLCPLPVWCFTLTPLLAGMNFYEGITTDVRGSRGGSGRGPRAKGRRDRPPKCARDYILSATRAHSTARHRRWERPSQSTRALLGVKMCPSTRRDLPMWSQPPPPSASSPEPPAFRARAASAATADHRWCRGCLDHSGFTKMVRREPSEYGVRVDLTSQQPAGLRVRDEPQYQNLEELRKRPEYANLDEISREYGYRLCPEGQNLEDEAIYENILSVRRIRSAEVRLVPMSEVPYYEGKGYVATQVLSRSGTFPQCPPHTWSRLQHASRMHTGSLRIFTVNINNTCSIHIILS